MGCIRSRLIRERVMKIHKPQRKSADNSNKTDYRHPHLYELSNLRTNRVPVPWENGIWRTTCIRKLTWSNRTNGKDYPSSSGGENEEL